MGPTVVVTGTQKQPDGTVEVFVAGHSPAYDGMPVDRLLAEHPGAAVYYWHLAR